MNETGSVLNPKVLILDANRYVRQIMQARCRREISHGDSERRKKACVYMAALRRSVRRAQRRGEDAISGS